MPTRPVLVSFAVLSAACGARGPYECPGSPADDSPRAAPLSVRSPAPGTVLEGTWTAVVVKVTAEELTAPLVTCLDGAPVPSHGVVRESSRAAGAGFDYIGHLDLDGLTPGTHTWQLVSRRGSGLALAETSFTWAPRAARVDVSLVDAHGAPASARVVVTDRDDRLVDLGSATSAGVDPRQRDARLHSFFVIDGTGSVYLDPGRYRLRAVRGVRDHLAIADVDVATGHQVVPLVVRRAVDTPAIAADLHVHTARSPDAFVPDPIRFGSLLAAGLDAVVITDHGTVMDPVPALRAAGGVGVPVKAIAGIEANLVRPGGRGVPGWDLGHLNAFPVADASVAPYPPEETPTVGAAIDAWRSRQAIAPVPDTGGSVVLQLNHPRGIHFAPSQGVHGSAWPLFNALGFDRSRPVAEQPVWTAAEPGTGTTALDFDAIEVLNRFSPQLYQQVRLDWFALLDGGWWLTGTGNSDSHAAEVELAGMPVNLIDAPRGPDGAADVAGMMAAIRAGRLTVTTGPVVDIDVTGPAGRGGPGALVRAAPTVTVRVRVRAAPWVPVAEVRLVHDGAVVATWVPGARDDDGVLDAAWTVELPVSADGWTLAEAGYVLDRPEASGDYALVAPGYVPIGFTNPVRLDGDGDGTWHGRGP